MPWIVAGGAIGGAAISGLGASKAAKQQARATEAATAEQRRQYDQTRADYAPWHEAGGGAISRISQLLGLGESEGDDFGALNQKFTIADFMDDPVTKLGYQSGLDLGTEAIDRMAGARGSRNSGATLKALTRFGTDYTGRKAGESYGRFYGDQDRTFNRLSGVSGSGQTATQNLGQIGSQTSSNIGNLLTAQGNARGAASIAQGQAYGGALQNIGNWYSQNQMLDKILAARNPPTLFPDDR
jgi:hypothetical protein